jgi:invasion protein IalB
LAHGDIEVVTIQIVGAGSILAVAILGQPAAILATPSSEFAQRFEGDQPSTATTISPQVPSRYTQAQAPAPQPQQGPAAPSAPVRTEILRFDSWTVTCHEFAEGARKRTCNAQMQIQAQQQAGPTHLALTWTLVINDNKQLVMVLQTPTGVLIAPGVELTLDKAPKRTIPFESCDTGSCVASQVIDSNVMRDLSAAANVQVTVKAMNGNGVNFNFPVKGSDKALNHLRSKS